MLLKLNQTALLLLDQALAQASIWPRGYKQQLFILLEMYIIIAVYTCLLYITL